MDLKNIKKLINLVEQSQITGLCLEEDNVKIEIKKEHPKTQETTVLSQAQPSVSIAPPQPTTVEAQPEPAPVKDKNLISIKSPMVGTFYASSSPKASPFIKQGDKISTGQVICVVEAMKLFNEIESDLNGTIEDILVDNAQPVEYGQELFLVRVN